MKKIYYISIAILFVIFLIAIFLPFYEPLYFLTKHISFFLLISLILFGILKYFYEELIIEYNIRKYLMKALTVISFGFLLFALSEAQMIYIDEFETPEVAGCTYYDQYGNVIYDTILPENCGDVEVRTNTAHTLDITIIESLSNEFSAGDVDDNEIYPAWGDTFSGFKKTDITVTYDSLGRILTVMLLSSTNYEIVDKDVEYSYNQYIYYNSFKRVVINEYFEDSFKSTQKIYVLNDEVGNWTDLEEIEHYNFSEDSVVIEILRSGMFEDWMGMPGFFEVTKETIIENESTIEQIVALGYIEDIGGEYSKKISYTVLADYDDYDSVLKFKHYFGENSYKEVVKLSEVDVEYTVEFEDYKEINNLHKAKSFDIADEFVTYYTKNSHSLTGNRIYTKIETNSLGIIEHTEFGYKIEYYSFPMGFLERDTWNSRWKVSSLRLDFGMGGKYNTYNIYDYKYALIDSHIHMYFVHEDNPLISVYYD